MTSSLNAAFVISQSRRFPGDLHAPGDGIAFLDCLPQDLLLNIVGCARCTRSSLGEFCFHVTRFLHSNSKYRNHPLPLKNIRALGELTTSQLIEAVNKTAWPLLRTFKVATLPRGEI